MGGAPNVGLRALSGGRSSVFSTSRCKLGDFALRCAENATPTARKGFQDNGLLFYGPFW